MRANAKIAVLALIVSICQTSDANQRRKNGREPQEEPKNNLIFEKVEYEVFDTAILQSIHLETRPIARNVLKINASAVLGAAMNDIWGTARLHRKYATYQRYLIHLREDMCAFFKNMNNGNPLTKIIMENFTRFPIRCPFGPGRITAWRDRCNISEMSLPLMPAGRYRMDVLFTRKQEEHKFIMVKTYFSVSDIRVWF